MFPPPLASVSPARLGGEELSEFFSVLAKVSQVSDLICRLMLLGYLWSITTDKGFTSVDKGGYFICQCAQIWLVSALKSTVRWRVPSSCMKSCTQFTSILDQVLFVLFPCICHECGSGGQRVSQSLLAEGFSQFQQHSCLVSPFAPQRASVHQSQSLSVSLSPFGHHKLSVSLGTLILYIYRAAFMDGACGSLPVCGQSVISCTWLSSSDSTCSTEYKARSCTQ